MCLMRYQGVNKSTCRFMSKSKPDNWKKHYKAKKPEKYQNRHQHQNQNKIDTKRYYQKTYINYSNT